MSYAEIAIGILNEEKRRGPFQPIRTNAISETVVFRFHLAMSFFFSPAVRYKIKEWFVCNYP
jgi:hypothetical protein